MTPTSSKKRSLVIFLPLLILFIFTNLENAHSDSKIENKIAKSLDTSNNMEFHAQLHGCELTIFEIKKTCEHENQLKSVATRVHLSDVDSIKLRSIKGKIEKLLLFSMKKNKDNLSFIQYKRCDGNINNRQENYAYGFLVKNEFSEDLKSDIEKIISNECERKS